MNARALLLSGALLVSPAWAQEPSFDLSSESVRKIVRATAASQYAEFQPLKLAPAERKPASIVDLRQDVRLTEKPALKRTPPTRAPASTLPEPIAGLLETLLDLDSYTSRQDDFNEWHACHRAGDANNTTSSRVMCPGKSR